MEVHTTIGVYPTTLGIIPPASEGKWRSRGCYIGASKGNFESGLRVDFEGA